MRKVCGKIFGTVLFFFIISCSGTIEKSWIVTNFDQARKFEIYGEMEGKSYSTAIVTISGKVDENVCFRSNPNRDECRLFSKDTTFIKSRIDYYGGNFHYYMLPSKAKGKLKITIKLPYTPSI